MNIITQFIALLFIANIIAWFQIQGQFMSGAWGEWLSKDWVVIVLGVPIGWMLWKTAFLSYQYFGAVWNVRMIGFGMGTFIFGIMTWGILDELPGWHTGISIILAVAIIMLQFSNLTLK
jgi:hypothetical protein